MITSADIQPRRYLQSSGFVTDLLIGIADGIMLPYALAVALSLIIPDAAIVLLACAGESVVLAVLLGVATYQAVVNQAEEYPDEDLPDHVRERSFIPHLQLQQILTNLELGPEILAKAAEEGASYKTRWSELLSGYGLGEPVPDFARARKNSLYVGLSFLTGALLPILPYIFTSQSITALKYSTIITFTALITFGYFKAAYTGQKAWKGALRLGITGIITAGAAFLVAWLFRI